jgi:hypothetical protein
MNGHGLPIGSPSILLSSTNSQRTRQMPPYGFT